MQKQQISVFLENRVGQLAELTGLLKEAGVNLMAINIAETTDYGIVRIIADDEKKAVDTLTENGYICSTAPVVLALIENRPGGLDSLLRLIAEETISIEYMYSIFGSQNGRALMALRVDDPEKLTVLLEKNGLNAASGL